MYIYTYLYTECPFCIAGGKSAAHPTGAYRPEPAPAFPKTPADELSTLYEPSTPKHCKTLLCGEVYRLEGESPVAAPSRRPLHKSTPFVVVRTPILEELATVFEVTSTRPSTALNIGILGVRGM